jgi:glutathione synthase/RimK-type ligase-like ATP-grasp enzyme
MAHIRFITCQSLDGYFFDARQPALTIDDMILHDELVSRGHSVTPLVWSSDEANDPTGDLLLVRSPWDYFERPEEFKVWLLKMQGQNKPLFNRAEDILWNLKKNYLSEFEQAGIAIVPTLFLAKGEHLSGDFFAEIGVQDLVLKPQEGANAFLTERLCHLSSQDALAKINQALKERDFMLQPFLPQIIDEGEWSLVYFNGKYSHGFLKSPKKGDFRVQEEHGGSLYTLEVGENLIFAADKVMGMLNQAPLYARVDGVVVDGKFLLMELEMFEPELYFRVSDSAAPNMADAIEDLLVKAATNTNTSIQSK